MNTLLLLFAIPVATIILAIVLQKILRCPILVAATFFAIFLIVAFAVFDSSFLVLAILYTILAYVTAVLTRLICNIISRFGLFENDGNCVCSCGCNRSSNDNCSRQRNNGVLVASNENWCCTSRNNGNAVARIGLSAASSNNSNEENENSESEETSTNEPVIVLTNDGNLRNNQRRNGCQCRR